jgi:hypothetical protein
MISPREFGLVFAYLSSAPFAKGEKPLAGGKII